MTDDKELLRQYANAGSETAFGELVTRHLPVVYSAALRQVGGNHELAKDVAQTVFIDLARKARLLTRHEVLTGWLYTSTRFAAANARRSEQRRHNREEVAATMQALNTAIPSDAEWERITPMLDELMHELTPEDRLAVLMRFFERKNLKEVGLALGVSEDAARMRVTRALEKLHSLLAARGAAVSVVALGSVLAANAATAAPAALASSVTAAALAGAATANSGILAALVQNSRLHWKTLALSGAALLVAIVATVHFTHPRPPEKAALATSPPAKVPRTNAVQSAAASADTATVEPAPSAAQTMAFELFDSESGRPIPAAKLHVNYFREGGQMKTLRLETDALGRAAIPTPAKPWRGMNLFVAADGHVPKVTSWHQNDWPERYTMKAEAASTVSGVVVDEHQQPVVDARIAFHGPGNDLSRKENIQFGSDTEQRTDAAGRWSCNMIPKTYASIQVVLTHPDFATTKTAIPANSSRSGNIVLQIQRGVTVSGLVQDTAGRAVKGAMIRQVHSHSGPKLSAKTDANGRFAFNHLPAGELMLAVQAKGLAPEVVETNVYDSPIQFALVLQPGNCFKGRVVDEGGAPIPNAVAQTDWDNQGLRKLEWSVRTDAQGRFQWDSAPAEPLLYWFEADGFGWSRGMLLKADGTDHQITLTRKGSAAAPPSIRITGTANDAETGAPLEEFQVLFGEVFSIRSVPEFQFVMDGNNGKFDFTRSFSRRAGAYQVQVEKEGYVPAASTNLFLKDGNQSLVFKLQKGAGLNGIVTLPGGQPAPDATVFLCGGQGAVYMHGTGEFISSAGRHDLTRVQSDEAGRFSFPPTAAARGFVAAHAQGYAALPLTGFHGTIALQPWGRVEGTLTIAGQPAANETISLQNTSIRYSNDGQGFEPVSLSLEVKTDANGKFLFERVPPGQLRVSRRLTKPGSQLGRAYESHQVAVVVGAGRVIRVDLSSTGSTVRGRATFPSAASPTDWRRVAVVLRPKLVPAEAEITAVPSGGPAPVRVQRRYAAFCDADGLFLVPDVPPALYELNVEILAAAKQGVGPSSSPDGEVSLSSLAREVVVPEPNAGSATDIVDVGVLELPAATAARR